MLLFPETDKAHLEAVADRIRFYFENTIADPDSNCEVTISIGCTQITEEEGLARAITRSDDTL